MLYLDQFVVLLASPPYQDAPVRLSTSLQIDRSTLGVSRVSDENIRFENSLGFVAPVDAATSAEGNNYNNNLHVLQKVFLLQILKNRATSAA